MTDTPAIAYLVETILQQQAIIASYERVCQSMLRTGSVQVNETSTFYERVEALERELIIVALSMSKGNIAKAARQLKIVPKTLYNKIRQYHLETHTNIVRVSHSPIKFAIV